MNEPDLSLELSGLNETIIYISALTINALPNYEFEAHTHCDEFEIYHFIEGDLFFAFEGKRIALEAGTLIIISDSTLHRPVIQNPCRYHRKRILIKKDIFNRLTTDDFQLYNRLRERKILLLPPQMVKALGIDRLLTDIEQALSQRTDYEDFCALITLFSLLIKAEKNSEHFDYVGLHTHSKKVDELIQYIDTHLSEDLSYHILSEHLYISEKSLYKLFKNETGFTLSNYINERRIIRAQTILNAGGSANDAATAAGFKDYSVFYRSFLRKTGITPIDYIKKCKGFHRCDH